MKVYDFYFQIRGALVIRAENEGEARQAVIDTIEQAVQDGGLASRADITITEHSWRWRRSRHAIEGKAE